MATPPRLIPLLAQFDFARKRLADRMAGPEGDSGNGVSIEIAGRTDDEYLWEPVPNCWSIRPRAAGLKTSCRAPNATFTLGTRRLLRQVVSHREGGTHVMPGHARCPHTPASSLHVHCARLLEHAVMA